MEEQLYRVLIVDDDLITQKIHQRLLADMGFKVEIACNSSEALSFFDRSLVFDCVLLDMNLPDGHGIQIMEQIRKKISNQFSPLIIFVTSYLGIEIEKICLSAGADGFLTKPIDMQLLKKIIDKKG